MSDVHFPTPGRSGLAAAGPSNQAVLAIPSSLRQNRARLPKVVGIVVSNILGGTVIDTPLGRTYLRRKTHGD
jgi:hypothetical protein